ncbi:MAG: UbiA prenyltransferase family protein, partial [Planctomycetaceae bacterium]|nr:UbiA prenyltransferase family protein [Planctomycetaceae bacterium]
ASGSISPALGVLFSFFLAVTATATAYFAVSPAVCAIGLLYLVNNSAYCFNLRNKVILDVMSIAAGFVLRIFGGCLAVNAVPSNWMLICGFSLALLLGFGKRRLELFHRENSKNSPTSENWRKSLNCYPTEYVNMLLGVSSMMCLMSYMLYTTAPETIALHGSSYLIYTSPFVFYGVFRYAIRCIQGRGDGPVDVLTQDKSFMINAVFWAVAVGGIVFWR